MQFSSIDLAKIRWLLRQKGFRRQRLRVLLRLVLWEAHRLRGATLRVPFDGGTVSVHCADGAGRLLYYFRSFDDDIFAFLRRYLQPGQVVVDVGANIGLYSAFAAKRIGPGGRVFSFEPNPDVFARLQANAAGPNIRLLPSAVGPQSGSVGLCLNADTAKSSVMRHDAVGPVTEVPCITLDAFLRENLGSRRVDFLKIDVEGFDYDVLAGARECLARQRFGLVQTECTERRTDMFRLLADAGYRVCRLAGRGMVPLDARDDLPFNLFAFHPDIAGRWIEAR